MEKMGRNTHSAPNISAEDYARYASGIACLETLVTIRLLKNADWSDFGLYGKSQVRMS
jgi:hypothetical protein